MKFVNGIKREMKIQVLVPANFFNSEDTGLSRLTLKADARLTFLNLLATTTFLMLETITCLVTQPMSLTVVTQAVKIIRRRVYSN